MVAPATCPSFMMASGSTLVPALAVKMAIFGVPPPMTMAKTSFGDSVLSRVSYSLIC